MAKNWRDFLPPSDIDVHEENLAEFFLTMHERQEIWWRRYNGELRPWTENEILRDYKFCNVYRELDRSSQYLIKEVYLKETDLYQVVFSILAHRIFNKPETFERLAYPDVHTFEIDVWIEALFNLEKKGFKTLNQEAYKINTYMWGGEPRWYAYSRHILNDFHKRIDEIVHSVQNDEAAGIVKCLRKTHGCGMFLTHEYYQDFCDLNRYLKFGATKFDKNVWTNPGPGCKTGLRLLFPSLDENKAENGLRILLDISNQYLDALKFKYLKWNFAQRTYSYKENGKINISILEFWACEYAKYWKMKIGLGKQRQKFKPSVI